jgi:hypothetical protein
MPQHEAYIAAVIEQCVRVQPAALKGKRGVRAAIELLIVGDARRRGEIHRWMYDRLSLSELLSKVGFAQPRTRTCNESAIPDWSAFGLETNDADAEYKPDSVYVEALKQQC